MSIKLYTWGDYACFTRPEMKTERVSYDLITPSAARGLLEAIYWHPGLAWVIDSIRVCRPIRFTNIRRNEVKSKISLSNALSAINGNKSNTAGLWLNTRAEIAQRASMLLRDVAYIIEAHFEMTPKATPADNPGKFQDIIKRRIHKGQFYHQPCFGCREFAASFGPCPAALPPCPDELSGRRDLGYMLWDMDYSDPRNIRPLFFRAIMEDGLVRVPTRRSGEVIG